VNSEERKRIACRYGYHPLANYPLPRGNCRETNGSETLPLQYGCHPPANSSLSTAASGLRNDQKFSVLENF
jgi:hypothetical protein